MDKRIIIVIICILIGTLAIIIGSTNNSNISEDTICKNTCESYNMNFTEVIMSKRGLFCECNSEKEPISIVEAIR